MDGYLKGTNGFDKNPGCVAVSVTKFAEAGDVRYFKMMINGLLHGRMYIDQDKKEAYRRLLNRSTLYPNVPENDAIREFVRKSNVPCQVRARHTLSIFCTAVWNFFDIG